MRASLAASPRPRGDPLHVHNPGQAWALRRADAQGSPSHAESRSRGGALSHQSRGQGRRGTLTSSLRTPAPKGASTSSPFRPQTFRLLVELPKCHIQSHGGVAAPLAPQGAAPFGAALPPPLPAVATAPAALRPRAPAPAPPMCELPSTWDARTMDSGPGFRRQAAFWLDN